MWWIFAFLAHVASINHHHRFRWFLFVLLNLRELNLHPCLLLVEEFVVLYLPLIGFFLLSLVGFLLKLDANFSDAMVFHECYVLHRNRVILHLLNLIILEPLIPLHFYHKLWDFLLDQCLILQADKSWTHECWYGVHHENVLRTTNWEAEEVFDEFDVRFFMSLFQLLLLLVSWFGWLIYNQYNCALNKL